MTYLDPSGSTGDSTGGADQRRQRARHGGAAPEPYDPPSSDETLVFDQPLRTTASRRFRTEPRRTRAERRRAEEAAAAAGPAGAQPGAVPGGRQGAQATPATAVGRTSGNATGRTVGTAMGRSPGAVVAGPTDGPVNGSTGVANGLGAGPAGARGGPERAGGEDPASAQDGAQPGGRTSGRAGRNLPAAIGVGVSLGAVVLGSLLIWRPAFLAVVILAVAGGLWEMARAVRPSGAHPPMVPLVTGGVTMVGLAWFGGADALSVGLFLTVLAVIVWRISDGPAAFHRDITSAVLITVYVPFLGGFAALLAAEQDGHFRILATLLAVVLSDTGGYAAGVFFGRHPMAPRVSPKKSWEGLAGSLLATALGSALVLNLMLDVVPWWGAVFGLVISGAAVLGDLAESMIKRDLGVKDMSSLLPGHGGLMDRLDSILFALPAAYLMLSLLSPPG